MVRGVGRPAKTVRESLQKAREARCKNIADKENVPPPPQVLGKQVKPKETLEQRADRYQTALYKETRAKNRLKNTRTQLNSDLTNLKTNTRTQQFMAENQIKTLTSERDEEREHNGRLKLQLEEQHLRAKKYAKRIDALKNRIRRADAARTLRKRRDAESSARARSARFIKKGVYTPKARTLARILVASGCSRKQAGKVLNKIGKLWGVDSKREMSARTVGRAVDEGGEAAKMQLAYELTLNPGM